MLPTGGNTFVNPKILFLDLDGVLNVCEGGWAHIDSKLVQTLNELFLLEPKVQIVLTSVWRAGAENRDSSHTVLRMRGLEIIPEATEEHFANDNTYVAVASNLKKIGCIGRLHPDWATPSMPHQMRSAEVAAWLARHPEVADYVIFDDCPRWFEDSTRVIAVNPQVGLTPENIRRATDLLGVQSLK